MELNIKDLNSKIFLLKEKVDIFEYSQKTDQELILFMKEYHKLENEILSIFRIINEDENNKEITKLLSIFQKYWKSYQDNWPSHYWDVYNLVYDDNVINQNNQKGNDENIISTNQNQFFINNVHDESIVSANDFKNGIEIENLKNKDQEIKNKNKFLLDDDSVLYNNPKHGKNKNNMTKDQTKSITNLDDIDKELDGVLDKSIIKDAKDSKNRNCLDCIIL